jgi:CBS domain containing-hemolysin-like protein
MTVAIVILAVLLFMVLAGVAALAEFSAGRLEKICHERGQPELVGEILDDDEKTLVSLRAWFWLLLAGLFQCSAATFGGPEVKIAGGLAIAFGTWFGGMALDFLVARPIGVAFAEPILVRVWPALKWIRMPMLPVAALAWQAQRLWWRIGGWPADGPPIEEEIRSVVEEGEREGTIKEDAAEMIDGLVRLHRSTVADVMTTRTDLTTLPGSATIDEAARLIRESGRSRIPVHGDSRDDIVGILYAKDLVPVLAEPAAGTRRVDRIPLRKPLFVPENKPLDLLLTEFRRSRMHMAVVLDEFGGVAGAATIEDVLEEIVGEIEDEHDDETDDSLRPVRIDERTVEVSGRTATEVLAEFAPGLIEPDEASETIGGHVSHRLGRFPAVGETFVMDGLSITVLAGDGRRLDRLRLVRAEP